MAARYRLLPALLAILAVACGSVPGPGSSGDIPSPQSQAEVKYRVIAAAGTPFYCGPPVVFQGYEEQQAAAQFPAIRADTATYAAIVAHAHPVGEESSSAYQVAVWRQWRQLQAVQLAADGSFEVRTEAALVSGRIDAGGHVTITSSVPGRAPCPICLPAATEISTPSGPVPVASLKVGDAVWTALPGGARVAAVVLTTGSVAFPGGHDAVRVSLSDGRAFTASGGHPTADDRNVAQLRPGEPLDGAVVLATTWLRLTDGATYDILPSGATGDYWAGGVLLGSTLHT